MRTYVCMYVARRRSNQGEKEGLEIGARAARLLGGRNLRSIAFTIATAVHETRNTNWADPAADG